MLQPIGGDKLECDWSTNLEVGEHCELFFDDVTKDLEGIYRLNVKFNKKALQFTFKLRNKYVGFSYDYDLSIDCVMHYRVDTLVVRVDYESEEVKLNNRTELNFRVNAHRMRLTVERNGNRFRLAILADSVSTKLHILALTMMNSHSRAFMQTSFAVIDSVILKMGKRFPATSDCCFEGVSCKPTKLRVFQCVEDWRSFRNIYQNRYGLLVEAKWSLITSNKVESIDEDHAMLREFSQNKLKASFVMQPLRSIKNADTQMEMYEKLHDAKLFCRITMKTGSSSDSTLVYDSEKNELINSRMRVHLETKQDWKEHKLAQLSIGFITMMVVLGVLYKQYKKKNPKTAQPD